MAVPPGRRYGVSHSSLRETPFSKIFPPVAKRLGIEETHLRLLYQGERLTAPASPLAMDMDGEEELDAFDALTLVQRVDEDGVVRTALDHFL
ncbi:hypothetical protein JCM11641_001648 [Rhodosporidiobolus odoratus]